MTVRDISFRLLNWPSVRAKRAFGRHITLRLDSLACCARYLFVSLLSFDVESLPTTGSTITAIRSSTSQPAATHGKVLLLSTVFQLLQSMYPSMKIADVDGLLNCSPRSRTRTHTCALRPRASGISYRHIPSTLPSCAWLASALRTHAGTDQRR